MRTNIVIDDALMAETLKATGLKTKREVVELGLRTLLDLRRQAAVRELRGRLAWEGDLDALDVGDGAAASSAAPTSDAQRLLTWGASLLTHLAKINRFDLTLDFADKKTTTTLEKLLEKMGGDDGKAEGIDETTVAAIRKAYKL